MKNCLDCSSHTLHLMTLAKTLDMFERRAADCKLRNHDGRPKITNRGFSSLCIECLAIGFSTAKVLSDQVLSPVDPQGRPIMDSTSSPLDGGVWPVADQVQQQAAERRRQGFWAIGLGVFAFLIFLASLATMSIWLARHNPHF